MFDILGIFKSAAGVIDSIGNSVDKISTTSEEKGKIKIELQKLQNNLTEQSLKLQMAVLEQENKLIEKSQSLLLADAKSDDKLQRRTRPIISLGLFVIVAVKYIVDIFYSLGVLDRQITFDNYFWIATFSIWGIYAGSRGIEKTVRSYQQNKTQLPSNIRM